MTEDRDQYGPLLRYMRYKAPVQEVWIVDSSLPLHDAVRKNMMDQVVCQQELRKMTRNDLLVAKQAHSTFLENKKRSFLVATSLLSALLTIITFVSEALRVSGTLREADTSWVSGKASERMKQEDGELWPSVLLEVGMDRSWEEMVSDINDWLQHSTNMTQAAIAIKVTPNSNKKDYRAHVQAWTRSHTPPFEPIPIIEYPVQFGSEVEASQWTNAAIKIPWKFFYAIDSDVLLCEGFDDSWDCQHLELCKALHSVQHDALPSKAQGDFALDLIQLHRAIEPLLGEI